MRALRLEAIVIWSPQETLVLRGAIQASAFVEPSMRLYKQSYLYFRTNLTRIFVICLNINLCAECFLQACVTHR